IGAVGALPTLLNAQVAINRIRALALDAHEPDFAVPAPFKPDWQCITLEDVRFRYADSDGGDEGGFAVGPINLTLNRGELVFLIGANGSGKTTLARLLTGLYQPTSGRICVDDIPVTQ